MVITGLDDKALNNAILEFDPGTRLDLYMGIERSLSDNELQAFADGVAHQGVEIEFAEMGSGPWPNTLRMIFTRPNREGYGFLLPVIVILGTLGFLGISGYLGFKLGNVIDAVSKYIIPLSLVAAGVTLLGFWVYRKTTPEIVRAKRD